MRDGESAADHRSKPEQRHTRHDGRPAGQHLDSYRPQGTVCVQQEHWRHNIAATRAHTTAVAGIGQRNVYDHRPRRNHLGGTPEDGTIVHQRCKQHDAVARSERWRHTDDGLRHEGQPVDGYRWRRRVYRAQRRQHREDGTAEHHGDEPGERRTGRHVGRHV